MNPYTYTPRLGIRQRLIFGVAGIIAARRDYDPDWSIETEREVETFLAGYGARRS